MEVNPNQLPPITEDQEDEVVIWLATRLRIMAWQRSMAVLSDDELALAAEMVLEWQWLHKWRNDFRIVSGVFLINTGVLLAMWVILGLDLNVSGNALSSMVGGLCGLDASMALFFGLFNIWRARIVPPRRPRYVPRWLWGPERLG